jgi:hypothetical protein
MLALETYGGQSCILFGLYLTTLVTSAFHLEESDLTKQAFAAIIGFLTGNALARGRK